MRMSMDGDGVFTRSRPAMSYTPVAMKSVRTLFVFEAHSRRRTGTPMRLA